MPVYEVECPECGKQEIFYHGFQEVDGEPCPVCGQYAPRVWNTFYPQVFKPYVTQALSLDPIKVESKKQEKEMCKKHGVYRDK